MSLRKTSLVDYPGKVAATLFFPGCNLRCPWCHNRDLVLREKAPGTDLVSLAEALSHIEKRRAVLGGVVLSGGEPCLFTGLADLIRHIKQMGLAAKLDTNGMVPQVLARLFQDEAARPDYIALDLKLAPERYGELLSGRATMANPGEALKKSADLIRTSGITHEFRSLALPNGFFGPADIEALIPLAGNGTWHIRTFRPGNCLDPAWDELPGTGRGEAEALERMAREIRDIAKPGNTV
ncbi:anaerobic ribonucleoside-triphosphate reductase activating protein [Spirochaetia bacterium]|nr:anaerobic ribonucleoside-triphosphate reductase activating protein [Spirochaetia bacterium]